MSCSNTKILVLNGSGTSGGGPYTVAENTPSGGFTTVTDTGSANSFVLPCCTQPIDVSGITDADGDTGLSVTEGGNDTMIFTVDGTPVMTLTTTKLTLNGVFIDPATGLELTPQTYAQISGLTANPQNTFYIDSVTGRAHRGTVDLEAEEVVENSGALSGVAPSGAKYGVDTTTGQSYYVNAGSWVATPVASIDLNTHVGATQVTDYSGGAGPIGAPSGVDDGDLFVQAYNDVIAYWVAAGGTFSGAANTTMPVNLNENLVSADLTGTANRTHSFNDFGQTWNNLTSLNIDQSISALPGSYGSTNIDTGNFDVDALNNTGATGSLVVSPTTVELFYINGTESAGIRPIGPANTSVEVFAGSTSSGSFSAKLEADADSHIEFSYGDGTNTHFLRADSSGMYLQESEVDAGVALSGYVLTLVNSGTGEVKFAPGGGADTNLFSENLVSTASRTHVANDNFVISGAGNKTFINNSGSGGAVAGVTNAASFLAGSDGLGASSSIFVNNDSSVVFNSNSGVYSFTTAPETDSDAVAQVLLRNTADGRVYEANPDSFKVLVDGSGAPVDGVTTAYYVGQIYIDYSGGGTYRATAKSTDPDVAAVGSAWTPVALADTNFANANLSTSDNRTHTIDGNLVITGAGQKQLTDDDGALVSTISAGTTGVIGSATDGSGISTLSLNRAGNIAINASLGSYQLNTAPATDSDVSGQLLARRALDGLLQEVSFDAMRTLENSGAPVDGTTVAYYPGQLYVDYSGSKFYRALTKSSNPDTAGAGSTWQEISVGGNIYTADGSLNGNRVVDLSGFSLNMGGTANNGEVTGFLRLEPGDESQLYAQNTNSGTTNAILTVRDQTDGGTGPVNASLTVLAHGQTLGFSTGSQKEDPSGSFVEIRTVNLASGIATAGQALTLNASGYVEYADVAGKTAVDVKAAGPQLLNSGDIGKFVVVQGSGVDDTISLSGIAPADQDCTIELYNSGVEDVVIDFSGATLVGSSTLEAGNAALLKLDPANNAVYAIGTGISIKKFVSSFTQASWANDGSGLWSLGVSGTTHGVGTDFQVQVWEGSAAPYSLVGLDAVQVDASGNLTLVTTQPSGFDGKFSLIG